MPVRENIRAYLVENDISQVWLSEQTRISLSNLNASLEGNRKLAMDEFVSILNALEVDANTFIKLAVSDKGTL